MKAPIAKPEDETEPRIMLQILYNLLRHIEDVSPNKDLYNNLRQIAKRLHKIQRLSKVYVKKTGGIT